MLYIVSKKDFVIARFCAGCLENLKMYGSLEITFLELFLDTFETHGQEFCYDYYVRNGGMEIWEFNFWIARVGASE